MNLPQTFLSSHFPIIQPTISTNNPFLWHWSTFYPFQFPTTVLSVTTQNRWQDQSINQSPFPRQPKYSTLTYLIAVKNNFLSLLQFSAMRIILGPCDFMLELEEKFKRTRNVRKQNPKKPLSSTYRAVESWHGPRGIS